MYAPHCDRTSCVRTTGSVAADADRQSPCRSLARPRQYHCELLDVVLVCLAPREVNVGGELGWVFVRKPRPGGEDVTRQGREGEWRFVAPEQLRAPGQPPGGAVVVDVDGHEVLVDAGCEAADGGG